MICTAGTGYLFGGNLSVTAQVKDTDIFKGEPFMLTVQVRGTDTPVTPDMSVITDFDVQSAGKPNSQVFSYNFNGRQITRRTLVYSYILTPLKTGRLTIPPVTVQSGPEKDSTRPIVINVRKPSETEDFKLRIDVRPDSCYTGQPVTLTATWYVGRDVRDFRFTLPVLSDSHFETADIDTEIGPGRRDRYLHAPVNGEKLIAEKGEGTLDGKKYLTVRFSKVLIPRKPGTVKGIGGTVVCLAVTGYTRKRSRDPFDDFFGGDFSFGPRKRAVTKKYVVPSNSLDLTVKPLPEQGRPADFSGLVGKYSVTASAAPTDVYVGDPITLTVRVTGPHYLDNVELPPLGQQTDLTDAFKIPSEMAEGKVNGPVKVFTQTIRAKRADVKEIPRIRVPYFDAQTETYTAAYTEPIPLSVKGTRVVTAMDAEGTASGGVPATRLEKWSKGIAHNYEDMSVIEDMSGGQGAQVFSAVWWVMMGTPVFAYLLLFSMAWAVRRRTADPDAVAARRAYRRFIRDINGLDAETSDEKEMYVSALELLKQYLGSKLRIPDTALTYRDVEQPCAERGLSSEEISALQKIFQTCEQSGYAGMKTEGSFSGLRENMSEWVKKAERKLT